MLGSATGLGMAGVWSLGGPDKWMLLEGLLQAGCLGVEWRGGGEGLEALSELDLRKPLLDFQPHACNFQGVRVCMCIHRGRGGLSP